MSVRIYELSKQIDMENSELIELLRERGFSIKSASSTIDNISAESIREEFAKKKESESEAEATVEAVKESVAKKAPAAPSIASFVKSADQIRKEKEASKAPQRIASVVPPTPRGPAPVSAPPRVKPAPSSPKPAGPPPVAASVKLNPPVKPHPAPPPGIATGAPVSPEIAHPAAVAPPSSGSVAAVSDEVRHIVLKPPIVVRDLANELGVKPFKLISELMEMGIFASINQSLEEEVAGQLAERHGCLLEVRHRGEGKKKKKEKEKVVDESAHMEHRPPVVCIMGHVDHGKTSLLDYIRKANVTTGEAGGITQHIGAYQVEHNDHKITFLDTPGHSAFNAMRERGANVTDIAILLVAADDGFMPQTDEALKYIQKAGVQPIVAINKIDTKGANIDRVKQQMQERGIASEDWGGEVLCVPISAIKGDGIDELMDNILLQAEVLELQANPQKPAEGVIIEAQIEIGRGPTASIIVQGGTLKVGNALVCGPCYTKVKALFNEHGKQVKEAPPSTPVRVIGWSGTPDCGATFETVKSEKVAKALAEENLIALKASVAEAESDDGMTAKDRLFAAIAKTQKKTLRLVIKGDAFGSVEAIAQALSEIKSDKVALDIISKGVGVVSKSDVQKASAGNAEIIGFNVKSENGVVPLAKHHAVKISTFQIIYELIDRVRDDMVDMLDAEYRENKVGAAEVRAVFPISKGFVAGCLVTEGRVLHGAKARVLRKGKVQIESKVAALRRVKDDVKEVRAGTECGIQIEKYNDYQAGDVIEIIEIHEVRPEL